MKYLLVIAVLLSAPAFAEEINTKSIKEGGFEGVGKIIDQMTPEQKAAVMKQALEIQKELEKMSPEERKKLEDEMRATASTIDPSTIDVKKIDPSKSKNLHDIQKDVREYNKAQGQSK